MNCPVQNYLRNGGSLKELTEKYAIKIKRHSIYPNLCQAKYDQIASPMGDPIVQSCRGIILNETQDWDIVARPFDKFFNEGEGHAAKIDWNTARVQEKLDGSLAIVYFYRGTWHMATSGTPDGSGQVGSHGMTFSELFWKTWEDLNYDIDDLGTGCTYMFELMTKYNRIVVPHEQSRIVLLGVRHTLSGKEIPTGTVEAAIRDARNYRPPESARSIAAMGETVQFPVVREFPLHDSESIQKSFEMMDGLHQEGYVVVDHDFHRIKVKHPQYVAYHHLVGSLTPKKVLEAVRHGESPEILSYFPEWKAEFDDIGGKLAVLVQKYEDAYKSVKAIPVQKDFAIAVQKLGLPTAPFFAVRKSEQAALPAIPAGEFVVLTAKRLAEAQAPKSEPITFKQYFAEVRLESLAEWLNLKEEVADGN